MVGKVGDEGEESLEGLEPFVDTLRDAVVHRLYDGRVHRDCREEDGAGR